MTDSGESFWDHVDALRGVLLRIAATVLVLGVAAFMAMPWIFDSVVLAPTRGSFPLYRLLDAISGSSEASNFHANLINIQLASQFFIHMSSSCWTAIIVGFPIILYQLWSFVSPALYPHERRGIRKAFLAGCVMFYLGVACGYFLVFPLAFRFLSDYQLSESIPNVIGLDSYMDYFYTLILVMGVVFEIPLLAWLLGRMGILTRRFFNHYRRHAIVVLVIAAAIITPTGDPFTLLAVFIPLYVLWEFSASLTPR